MVTRLARSAIALNVICALLAGSAQAATTTTKPSTKPTTTSKPTVKKPTAKKPVTKKTIVKAKIVTRDVKVTPAPKPVWPPKNFRVVGEIYARIPTAPELIAILSADKLLTLQAKQCIKKACGVVRLASTKGCTWWEILSKVSGPASPTDSRIVVRGNLRTTAKSTGPKQIITVYLISDEGLTPKTTLGGLEISCYHSPVAERIPTNSYRPIIVDTPSETPSASSSPSTSQSPSSDVSATPTSG